MMQYQGVEWRLFRVLDAPLRHLIRDRFFLSQFNHLQRGFEPNLCGRVRIAYYDNLFWVKVVSKVRFYTMSC